jgi:putative ABC transport system permease protein
MMAAERKANRAMFWRIMRRILGANRGRLFVILLALGAGAAVTAALLNLQIDARRRLTTEFRVLGSNVVVAPRSVETLPGSGATLDQAIVRIIPGTLRESPLQFGAYLHAIVDLSGTPSGNSQQVVLAGFDGALLPGEFVNSSTVPMAVDKPAKDQPVACIIGGRVASQMQIRQGMQITLRDGGRQQICEVAATMDTGGAEDNEVFIKLEAAQRLANAPGRISLIKLSVPGTPQEITRYIADLQQKIPEGDVRGIRQFTEGEAKIYNRISGLLTATVAIVLLLTGLCVMAAMTNVAMERKTDVGLMKAIGGSMRSVLHLFLAEAALLGLAGGLIGAALGILLSMGLGKAVFGVAARPRLIVYPEAVALTIIVAILSAFPLRRLANIRPASVFRGEA